MGANLQERRVRQCLLVCCPSETPTVTMTITKTTAVRFTWAMVAIKPRRGGNTWYQTFVTSHHIMTRRYKFINDDFKSKNGDHKWEVGKLYTFKGDLELCKKGFHCSKGIYQAFSYVQGSIFAEVECLGKHIKDQDNTKEVWEKMKIIKVWKWQNIDSILFSIYAANLVVDNFEKVYPNDDRPRKAIEAAKTYALNPTEENRLAAESAARSAAESAVYKKLDAWMLKHLKELEEIK